MFRFRELGRRNTLRAKHTLTLEQLEERRLMSITSSTSTSSGQLTLIVGTPDNDDIVITVVDGNVKINNQNPPSGVLSASTVNHIRVTGGPSTAIVDLQAVTDSTFPHMIDSTISFTEGNGNFMMMAGMGMGGGEEFEGLVLEEAGEELIADPVSPETALTPWWTEPAEENIPAPLDAESRTRSFESLAAALIGPNWQASLGIDNINDPLTRSEWRTLIANNDFSAAIDPARMTVVAERALGPDWTAQLGIADIDDYVESGTWRELLDADASTSVAKQLASQIELVASNPESTASFYELASQIETPMFVTAGPHLWQLPAEDDGSNLMSAAAGAVGLAASLVKSEWSAQINVADVADVIRSGRSKQVLADPRVSQMLDPAKISTFAAASLGPDWASQLGISNLPAYLESGAWRNLLAQGELDSLVGSAIAADIQAAFAEIVDPASENLSVSAQQFSGESLEAMEGESEQGFGGGFAMATVVFERHIIGSWFNDKITGTSDNDIIDGGEGNDYIKGMGGDDQIDGGLDSDSLYGGDGDDILRITDGNDSVYGEYGNDSIVSDLSFGLMDDQRLDGGEGDDFIQGIEGSDHIDGAEGDDLIYGSTGLNEDYDILDGNDEIYGGDGNDEIHAGYGSDSVDGGEGDDLIYGDAGDDSLDGAEGADDLYGGDGNDRLDGEKGIDRIFGEAGFDNPEIADNADAQFTGTWGTLTGGFNGGQRSHTGGTGANQALWSFSNLPEEDYQVFASWTSSGTASSNAPFTVFEGSTSLGSYTVDQRLLPGIEQLADRNWHYLGTYHIASGDLSVRLTDAASGIVIADAIRLQTNRAPVIASIGTRTIQEERLLSFRIPGSDPDLPVQGLTYSLEPGAPVGAAVSADGLFTWRPTEQQGPASYPITVRVTDDGSPPLSKTATFTVSVTEQNRSPNLAHVEPQTASAQVQLTLPLTASDPDLPTNGLVFTLEPGAPTGMNLSTAGVLTWIPTTAQAGKTYPIGVRVTDNGTPALYDTTIFSITVNPVGDFPSTPDLAATSDLGSSSTDNITKADTPTFTGTAPAGSTVKLIKWTTDGQAIQIGSGTSSNGQYSIQVSSQSSGTYLIGARITDSSGNNFDSPSALSVVIDRSAPTSPTAPHLDSSSDSGISQTDNITSVTTPILVGEAEAGSKVDIINSSNSVVATGFANDGHYSIPVPLAPGQYALRAKSTDVAGNENPTPSLALTLTIDTSTPPATSVDMDSSWDTNITTDNVTFKTQPRFTGPAEAGATINLYSDGVLVSTGTASGVTYTIFPDTPLADGDHNIVVEVVDKSGNSVISSPLPIVIDTLKPEKPGLPDLDPLSDSGVSDSDNKTNILTPILIGAAETGTTIELKRNISSLGSSPAVGGTYSFQVPTSLPLLAGGNTITARATDLAGNQSPWSDALVVTVTVTTAAPATPGLVLASSSDSGLSTSDRLTNVTTPVFTGSVSNFPNPVRRIELYSGTDLIGSTELDGTQTSYSIKSIPLADGVRSITARAVDVVGNTATSSALSVTIDTQAPSAPPIPDLDAASDNGGSNTDNVTSLTSLQFNLTTDANSSVQILANGHLIGSATGTNGVYHVTNDIYHALPNGTYAITAVLTDASGNSSAPSDPLSVTVNNAPFTAGIQGTLGLEGGKPTVNEGTQVSLTGYYNDPTYSNDTYSWQVSSNSGTQVSGGTGSTFSFTPTDNGTYTVTLTVTNSGNFSKTASIAIEVKNVAPSLTNLVTLVDSNGGTGLLTGTITDPGSHDSFTVTVDWGDGSTIPYSISSGTTDFSLTHDFPAGLVSGLGYSVQAQVRDDDGGGAARGTTTISDFVWPETPALTGGPEVEQPTTAGPNGLAPPVFTGPIVSNSAAEATASDLYNQRVSAATQQYNSATYQAQADYNAAVSRADYRRTADKRPADTKLAQDLARPNPVDTAAAQATYDSAISQSQLTWAEEEDDARDARATANAATALAESQNQISDQEAIRQYADANFDYSKAVSDSTLARELRDHAAWTTYRIILNAAATWTAKNQIQAYFDRDVAYAAAEKTYSLSVADAQQAKDRQIASADRTQDRLVADAATTRDKSIADGLVAAAQRANAIQQSAWSAYQVTVVQHARDHSYSIADLGHDQAYADADALYEQATELADRQHDRGYELAEARQDYNVASKKAQKDLALTRETNEQDSDAQAADLYRALIDSFSNERHDYDVEIDRAYKNYIKAKADLNEGYNPNQHTAQENREHAIAHNNLSLDRIETDIDLLALLQDHTSAAEAAYEKQIHALKEGQAEEEADLAETAENKDIAANADYVLRARTADDNYALAATVAIATRIGSQEDTAESFAIEEAQLARQHAIQVAEDEAAFKDAVMGDYFSAITTWAQTESSLWATRVVQTMAAEKTRIHSDGLAATSYATLVANADLQSAVAAAHAQRGFAADESDAIVRLKTEVSDADIDRAGTLHDEEIERGEEKSAAKTILEKAIFSANKGLEDQQTDQWHAGRTEINRALRERSRKFYEISTAESNEEISHSEATALQLEADELLRDELTAAYRSQQDNLAAFHITWVGLVSDAKNTAAQSTAEADIDWASAVADANVLYAQLQANSGRAFEYSMATADYNLSLDQASADFEASLALAAAARGQSHSQALADRQYALDKGAAERSYAVNLADAHADDVAIWATSEGTSLAAFQASVAVAELVYQQGKTAADAYFTSTTSSNALAHRDEDAADDYTLAIQTAAASRDYVVQLASLDQQEARKLADANRDHSYQLNSAEARRAEATVVADAGYSVDQTTAASEYAEADAAIVAEWMHRIAQATVITGYGYDSFGHWGPIYSNDPNRAAAIAAANAWRTEQEIAINIDRVTDLGGYALDRAEILAEADLALADDVGSVEVDFATQAASAANSRATNAEPITNHLTEAEVTAQLRNRIAHSENERVSQHSLAAAQLQQAIDTAEAASGYTHQVALAESSYDSEWAAQNILAAAALATNLGTPEADFVSQYATAAAEWLANTAMAFLAAWDARADADYDQAVGAAQVQKIKLDAAADFEADYEAQVAAADAQHQHDDRFQRSGDAVTSTSYHGQYSIKLAVADADLMVATARALFRRGGEDGDGYVFDALSADIDYQIAKATNPTTYNAGLANYNEALRQANIALVAEQGLANVDWTTAVSSAEAILASDNARVDRDSTLGIEFNAHTYAHAAADVLLQRDQALADVVAAALSSNSQLDQTEVDARWALATAQANASFFSAKYTASTVAFDSLDSSANTPLSHYLSQKSHALSGWASQYATNLVNYVEDSSDDDLAENAEIAAAERTNTLDVAQANFDRTYALADEAYNRAAILANQRFEYIDGVAQAAADYETEIAEARRQYADDMAEATTSAEQTAAAVARNTRLDDASDHYGQNAFDAAEDPRELSIDAVQTYVQRVSSPAGIMNVWQGLVSDANLAATLTLNDSRWELGTDAANMAYDFLVGAGNARKSALQSFDASNASPWASLEATVAGTRADSILASATGDRTAGREQANTDQTTADESAEADYTTQTSDMEDWQASLLGSSTDAYLDAVGELGEDRVAAQSGGYTPPFTPAEIDARSMITEATAGRRLFSPGSPPSDGYFGSFGLGYDWWGYWGGWSGYWSAISDGLSGWLAGGYGIGYGAGWYGYGYNGGAITQNTDLGSREAAIAAQASSAATYTPPAEATPGSVHFGEGLAESSFVAAVVPVETMLASRDQLFAQTSKQSFWADPLNQPGPTFDGPSAQYLLNLASAVQGQSNGSQPTFDELVDAAYDEIGFTVPDSEPAPSEVPEEGEGGGEGEGEGEEPAAAAQTLQLDYKVNLNSIRVEVINDLIKEGKAFKFEVNGAGWFDPDARFVIVPNYTVDGREFVNNLVLRYRKGSGDSSNGRNPSFYALVAIDNEEISPSHTMQLLVSNAYIDYAMDKTAATAAQLTFALHLVPTGAAIDNALQGNKEEAIISAVGDLALLAGGIGKVGAVARTTWAARTAVAVEVGLEGGVGIYRAQQAVQHFNEDKNERAAGELGEAFLRILGVAPSVIKGMTAATRAASSAADDALRTLRNAIPFGFVTQDEFANFGKRLASVLTGSGITDAKAYVQGSAVTGVRANSKLINGNAIPAGAPFDAIEPSDFDISIVSPELFQKAVKAGIPTRGGGTRTAALKPGNFYQLGLGNLRNDLLNTLYYNGRKINFMIFDSVNTVNSRGPSIEIPGL